MLTHADIPTAELRQIRRHRDPENPAQVHPWLRDFQIAVDQGRGVDAVAILQAQNALSLHDTRAQAMGAMVDEWDQWRRGYQPTESALIVHGPRSSNPSTPTATRSPCCCASPAPNRASSRSTRRAYAPSTPPANGPRRSGSTSRCTASPPKAPPSAEPPRSPVTGPKPSRRPTSATPVRSTARASTSPARISAPTAPTRTTSTATRSASPRTASGRPASARPLIARGSSGSTYPRPDPSPSGTPPELQARAACRPRPPRPTRDRSLAIRGGDARAQRPPRKNARLESMLPDPPEPLVRALGPVPEEHIARERWEREARRLEALGSGSCAAQPPASAEPAQPTTQSIPQRQARPAPRSPQRDFPTIRR